MASSHDFRFFLLEQGFPFRDLPVMPTICLLVADQIEPPYEYDGLVTDLMAVGCGFFMTWGAAASKFEDVIDETVVDLSIKRNDGTFAMTSAHQDESAEDVAFFMLKSALPDEQAIRCCIGFASHVPSAREAELRREIEKIVGN
ncbi:MAG TPA: hypothetical protein VGJ75_18220 [Dongiaceae bacterium]|jgi:hypothetical protein